MKRYAQNSRRGEGCVSDYQYLVAIRDAYKQGS